MAKMIDRIERWMRGEAPPPPIAQLIGFRLAAIGLSVMLAFLVIANINVALKGSHVEGLEFGAWYYWLRPLFQPIFILWTLFVSGVIWKRKCVDHATSG